VSEQKIGPDVILHHCITFLGRRYVNSEDDANSIESLYKGRKKRLDILHQKNGQSGISGGLF